MPNATEEEILEASDTVRDLLYALYDVYLAHEEAGTLDEFLAKAREERIKNCHCELSAAVRTFLNAYGKADGFNLTLPVQVVLLGSRMMR